MDRSLRPPGELEPSTAIKGGCTLRTLRLVPVSAEVVFRNTDYDQMVKRLRGYMLQHGRMTVAEARDLLDTTRKYVLPLLEHLDSAGITQRDGDYRQLRP